jgi:hypothetical protein
VGGWFIQHVQWTPLKMKLLLLRYFLCLIFNCNLYCIMFGLVKSSIVFVVLLWVTIILKNSVQGIASLFFKKCLEIWPTDMLFVLVYSYVAFVICSQSLFLYIL